MESGVISIENMLIDIWKSILNVDSIQVTDNIFQLGANSLMVVQMLGRITTLYPIDIQSEENNLTAFFDEPTIEVLSKIIDHQLESFSV